MDKGFGDRKLIHGTLFNDMHSAIAPEDTSTIHRRIEGSAQPSSVIASAVAVMSQSVYSRQHNMATATASTTVRKRHRGDDDDDYAAPKKRRADDSRGSNPPNARGKRRGGRIAVATRHSGVETENDTENDISTGGAFDQSPAVNAPIIPSLPAPVVPTTRSEAVNKFASYLSSNASVIGLLTHVRNAYGTKNTLQFAHSNLISQTHPYYQRYSIKSANDMKLDAKSSKTFSERRLDTLRSGSENSQTSSSNHVCSSYRNVVTPTNFLKNRLHHLHHSSAPVISHPSVSVRPILTNNASPSFSSLMLKKQYELCVSSPSPVSLPLGDSDPVLVPTLDSTRAEFAGSQLLHASNSIPLAISSFSSFSDSLRIPLTVPSSNGIFSNEEDIKAKSEEEEDKKLASTQEDNGGEEDREELNIRDSAILHESIEKDLFSPLPVAIAASSPSSSAVPAPPVQSPAPFSNVTDMEVEVEEEEEKMLGNTNQVTDTNNDNNVSHTVNKNNDGMEVQISDTPIPTVNGSQQSSSSELPLPSGSIFTPRNFGDDATTQDLQSHIPVSHFSASQHHQEQQQREEYDRNQMDVENENPSELIMASAEFLMPSSNQFIPPTMIAEDQNLELNEVSSQQPADNRDSRLTEEDKNSSSSENNNNKGMFIAELVTTSSIIPKLPSIDDAMRDETVNAPSSTFALKEDTIICETEPVDVEIPQATLINNTSNFNNDNKTDLMEENPLEADPNTPYITSSQLPSNKGLPITAMETFITDQQSPSILQNQSEIKEIASDDLTKILNDNIVQVDDVAVSNREKTITIDEVSVASLLTRETEANVGDNIHPDAVRHILNQNALGDTPHTSSQTSS